MSADHEPASSFFSRWSARKLQERQALAQPQPQPLSPDLAPGPSQALTAAPPQASPQAPASPSDHPPPPTLADVEQLTAGSDFRAFVAPKVDPEVRNAAFKKLFHSDPHFNVMDGLDVYIDDYNTPDPLPKSIMRTMLQARSMGLLDDELKEQDLPPQAAVAEEGGSRTHLEPQSSPTRFCRPDAPPGDDPPPQAPPPLDEGGTR